MIAKNRVQFHTGGAGAEFLNGTNVNVSGTNFAKGNDRLWRRQVLAIWRGFVQHEPVECRRQATGVSAASGSSGDDQGEKIIEPVGRNSEAYSASRV
jgi:hypothetical protein